MNCSCGGITSDHQVVRDKQVIGEYVKCTSCGRISWINQHENFHKLFNNKANNLAK